MLDEKFINSLAIHISKHVKVDSITQLIVVMKTFKESKVHEFASFKTNTPANHRQHKMVKLVCDCIKVLDNKKADYGIDNFIDAATFAKLYTGVDLTPMDVAAVLAGIKISRIRNLREQGKEPLHESITDSVQDFINYIAIETRERERYEQSKIQDEEDQTSSTPGAHES